jgi:hypothetical protein
MWGGTGLTPNTSNSKFGPDKTDNTPHTFTIDGKTVELYFSPSDGTNNHIQSALNSADYSLFFGIYTFTDNTDATIISGRISAGVYCAGIMDQYSTSYSAYSTLNPVMGNNLKIYTQSSSIYHNKFLLVDPCTPSSDPIVLTGSHNWTLSANTKNDENTVIIHDDTISNIYYQSFSQNFSDLGGTLQSCITTDIPMNDLIKKDLLVYPNPASGKVIIENVIGSAFEVSIMDMTGRIIIMETIPANGNLAIDVSLFNDGLYMVQCKNEEQHISEKLMIRK